MANNQKKIIASLDLGTDKIICLIGYLNDNGKVVVRGIGHQKSRGIVNGAITDIKLASQSIISAISTAEKMAGHNISRIAVNLSGTQVMSSAVKTQVIIGGREIGQKDILNTARDIKNAFRAESKEILHLIPTKYTIDGMNEITNPRNMVADDLEIDFHVCSTTENNVKNVEKCIKKTALTINNFIYTAYASALACMNESEMELGSLMIDVGASNTSCTIMYGDKFVFGISLPFGGIHVTRDLSTVMQISFDLAEKIKILNTDLTLDRHENQELIKVDIDDEESFRASKEQRHVVNGVYAARMQEILTFVKRVTQKKGFERYISSVVITGGGLYVPGIEGLVSDIFEKPARLSGPGHVLAAKQGIIQHLQQPIFSTSVGMLMFLQKMSERAKLENFENTSKGAGVLNFITKLFTS